MFVDRILPQARERLAVINGNAPLRDAAERLARPNVDLLVVCDGDAIAGVLTKTDVLRHLSGSPERGLADLVETIMAREVTHCRVTDSLLDVWQLMKVRGFRRVPIIADTRAPLGVASTRDVLQGLLQEAQLEDELLREYIFGVGYH